MAKRSFYVKDSELDDYQVKVINKKTDNVCLALRIETKTDYLDTPIVLSTDIFEECNDYYMENTEVIGQE